MRETDERLQPGRRDLHLRQPGANALHLAREAAVVALVRSGAQTVRLDAALLQHVTNGLHDQLSVVDHALHASAAWARAQREGGSGVDGCAESASVGTTRDRREC